MSPPSSFPACPSCCQAQGHPPATGPPRWPECDRVLWMHSALERVKAKLGVPRKLGRVLAVPRASPACWHGHSSALPVLPPALHAQPNVLGLPRWILRLPLDAPRAGTARHCVFCHPLRLSSAATQGTLTALFFLLLHLSLLAGFPSLSLYLVSFPSPACFPCFPPLHPAAQPCPAEVFTLLSLARAVRSALPSPCLQHFRQHEIIFLFPLVL